MATTDTTQHRIVPRRIPWVTHADPFGSAWGPPDTAWCLDGCASVMRLRRNDGTFASIGHGERIVRKPTW